MHKLFQYPLTINETNLDVYGHVNNATYLTLFEEARWELLNANNYGLEKISARGMGPVVLEAHINYLKELKARQEIIIETKMLDYVEKIGRLQQVIKRQDEICCTAEFVISLFDLKKRVLILPTPEWLQAIGMA